VAAFGPGGLYACDRWNERPIPRLDEAASPLGDVAMRATSACESAPAESRQNDTRRAAVLLDHPSQRHCAPVDRCAHLSELRTRLTSAGIDAAYLGTPPPIA
jgi:hypothetical protein